MFSSCLPENTRTWKTKEKKKTCGDRNLMNIYFKESLKNTGEDVAFIIEVYLFRKYLNLKKIIC